MNPALLALWLALLPPAASSVPGGLSASAGDRAGSPRLLPLPRSPDPGSGGVLRLRTEEPYQGGPIPENARVMRRDNSGWVVAGGLTLLLSYTGTTAVSSVAFPLLLGAQDTSDGRIDVSPVALLIPVVGPFLSFGFHDGPRYDPAVSAVLQSASLISGVLQLGGLVTALVAYFTQELVLVFEDGYASAELLPGSPGATTGVSLRIRWN